MKKLFNNILIPFNEVQDAAVAIPEAIRLACGGQCNIHLLYITHGHVDHAEGNHAFQQLKASTHERYCMGTGAPVSLVAQWQQGLAEKSILDYCIRHEIDLVLLAPRKRVFWQFFRPRSFVNISRLLKKLNCPVMTVFQQPVSSAIRNIVLPVGKELPMRKLLLATYLGKTAHATIHLVSLDRKSGDISTDAPDSLYRSYRLLRENTSLSVECLTMPGGNLAESAWRYAQKIKADLILINSGKESLLSGFLDDLRPHPLHNFYPRALFNVSRIPVMALEG